jgi:2-amino-4-hydroxy-6-hydroxymethyldihydropteridine diphosphokinase
MPDAGPEVTAFIGLGANLGDTRGALDDAMRRLDGLPGTRLIARSSIYRSAPIDSSGPDYLNAVAAISTRCPAHDLLAQLQAIELAHGRERPYHNAPRTLDLDLLLYGDVSIATAQLRVPHPRLHKRAFVLAPLTEIAPGLVIPGHGLVEDCWRLVADQRIDRLGA